VLTENDDRGGREINIKAGEEDTGEHGDVNIVTEVSAAGVEEIISPTAYVFICRWERYVTPVYLERALRPNCQPEMTMCINYFAVFISLTTLCASSSSHIADH
jgi:hypothetical protein